MEKKINIGIYTFTAANNYGAVLQAYALKKHLCNNGYCAHCINYRPAFLTKKSIPFSGIRIKMGRGGLIRRIVKEIIEMVPLMAKNRLFDKFRDSYLGFLPPASQNIDVFIVGSDQVWNYAITKGDRIFLGNIPNSHGKVISYAASMELCPSDDIIDDFRYQIHNFQAISVREIELKMMIENKFGLKCNHVVDPTLLLSPNEWRLLSRPYRISPKGFIFMYGFGFRDFDVKKVREFANKQGLDLIISSSGIKLSNGYSNYISPEQFLFLIDHATFIITNSFHGTIFSILFGKKMLEIPHNGLKRNSRVINLLQMLNANVQPFELNGEIKENDFLQLDYESKALQNAICESKEYLRKNLII